MRTLIYRLIDVSQIIFLVQLFLIYFILFGIKGLIILGFVKGVASIINFSISSNLFNFKKILLWEIGLLVSMLGVAIGYSVKDTLLIIFSTFVWQFTLRGSEYIHNKYINTFRDSLNRFQSNIKIIIFIVCIFLYVPFEVLDFYYLYIAILLRLPLLLMIRFIVKTPTNVQNDTFKSRIKKLGIGIKNLFEVEEKILVPIIFLLICSSLFRIIEVRVINISVSNAFWIVIPLYLLLPKIFFMLREQKQFLRYFNNLNYRLIFVILLPFFILKSDYIYYVFLVTIFIIFLELINTTLIKRLTTACNSEEIYLVYSHLIIIFNVIAITLETLGISYLLFAVMLLIPLRMWKRHGYLRHFDTSRRNYD
jgi:hypothetical protein